MSKARFVQAVCTIAMLAAAPAFAQNASRMNTPSPNAQNSNPGMAPSDQSSGNTGTMGGTGHPAMNSPDMTTHQTGMAPKSRGAMRGTTDTSQNAAVDQLNDQSLAAARNGQAFSGTGSMSDMSGGTMGTDQPRAAPGGSMNDDQSQTAPAGSTGSGR